jgi:hypothetical protein
MLTSKRRIGAFAVKGWVSGKRYSTMARDSQRVLANIHP